MMLMYDLCWLCMLASVDAGCYKVGNEFNRVQE